MAAAIAPRHSCLHDEQEQMLQIVARRNPQMVENDVDEDDDDAGLEEDLKRLRAMVAALQDEDDVLAAEAWDWAVGMEGVAKQAVERMEQEEAAIRRDLSSSSSSKRPGNEEAVELQAEAARVGELRGYAEDVVAATRHLREADLRRLAADAQTGNYSYILTLTHEELAVAAEFEFIAVAIEKRMASLAARLNHSAAQFAATPGEEAFVAAMRMEAAKADEARSAIARYRTAAGSSSLAPAGDQMEQDY